MVESCLRPLQLQFQEKGVALATDLAPGLPPLMADEQQLSWVITNLVTNALKYTDARWTRAGAGARGRGGIRIEVEDTGHRHRRRSTLTKIFDKFVQVKQLAESTPGSVGLGLAIAKEIVEMYGGRIWAESTPGKGSTFSFRLPVDPAAPAPTGAQR